MAWNDPRPDTKFDRFLLIGIAVHMIIALSFYYASVYFNDDTKAEKLFIAGLIASGSSFGCGIFYAMRTGRMR